MSVRLHHACMVSPCVRASHARARVCVCVLLMCIPLKLPPPSPHLSVCIHMCLKVNPKRRAGPNKLTIGSALYHALQHATSDYVLFLEKDFAIDPNDISVVSA